MSGERKDSMFGSNASSQVFRRSPGYSQNAGTRAVYGHLDVNSTGRRQLLYSAALGLDGQFYPEGAAERRSVSDACSCPGARAARPVGP
jgi:hypothetical protein